MAARKTRTTSSDQEPAPKPADSRDDLSLADLARGVLAKEIKPRVSDVRRLAEAALASTAGKKKAKGGGKKKDKARSDKKEAGRKVKTLAKIPGQKAKK
jgi:hypothetical protein